MATLKEHQAAMVDLLADGSGIPASASRLAHAMHDVLNLLLADTVSGRREIASSLFRADATTPGLNDKALSKREKAPKTDSPAKWPTPAEQRVKEMENTIRQLKENNAKLREDIRCYQAIEASLTSRINNMESIAEQAGCRKEDTQLPPAEVPCDHPEWRVDTNIGFCSKCGNFL